LTESIKGPFLGHNITFSQGFWKLISYPVQLGEI